MSHVSLNQALNIFEENICNIRTSCLENADAIIADYSPYEKWNIDITPVSFEAIKLHVNYLVVQSLLVPLLNVVKRIDSYRYYKLNPHAPNIVTDMDIQNAREADVDWFIQEAQLSTRKPHQGICPFHSDTNASLMLMKSKAKGTLYLKCFVCNEAWDSIGFTMKNNNLTFIDAVKYISC